MKTKTLLLVMLAFIGLSQMNAQVGVGTTTPDASAELDLSATDKGFLPPRLTTADRDAIANPAEGLTIFNTENGCLEFYNGTLWVSACDGSLQPGPVSDCSTPGFIAPYITADETEVVEVTITTANGTQTWMDRNLGAIAPARASDDCYAYGNLHQWGRPDDGHEFRGSNTHDGTNAADRPNNITDIGAWDGEFITIPDAVNRDDWVTTQTDDAWNTGTETTPIKTPTDPCPNGYRVPTETELNDLGATFATPDANGAIGSPLKLPAAGVRDRSTAALNATGVNGFYAGSTPTSPSDARGTRMGFYTTLPPSAPPLVNPLRRAWGASIRCIKD
jgi:uncharacterized protein (TIGR02145 family)